MLFLVIILYSTSNVHPRSDQEAWSHWKYGGARASISVGYST